MHREWGRCVQGDAGATSVSIRGLFQAAEAGNTTGAQQPGPSDFLNHLFAKHDGEARLIGGSSWKRLHEDVRNPEFWSCQFAPTAATRAWLAQREDPAQWLSLEDVEWILGEGEGETLLIRRDRASRDRAASGARFYFRTGTVVSLPEMMYRGLAQNCTCYDVYTLYVDFPVVVRKRFHPGVIGDRKRARAAQSGESTPASGGAHARS